jgi:hypothetical protein
MFVDLISATRRSFLECGYDDAFEVYLSPEQAIRACSELKVAFAVVDSAVRPVPDVPTRPGCRYLATVDGVHVFVRES